MLGFDLEKILRENKGEMSREYLIFKSLDGTLTAEEKKYYMKNYATSIELEKGKMYNELDDNDKIIIEVSDKNNQKGNLIGYDCKKCLNKGRIYKLTYDNNGNAICEEEYCECWSIRYALERLEKSGLKNLVNKYNFKTYIAEKDWQVKVLNKAKQFVKRADNNWFLYTGQSGSGKTHICTAICYDLIMQGYEVEYINWATKSRELNKLYVECYDDYLAEVEQLKEVSVLFIDDLFKGKNELTETEIRLLYEIINSRYEKSMNKGNKRCVTIINTEKTLEYLLQYTEIDAIVGRIIEMATKDNIINVFGKDKNYRLKDLF